MSKEIKSINVEPSAEEATINFWQIWGWELKSTQEVKTQDVQTFEGQSSDGSTNYYKTKPGEHYIKLTFEREKSMPNYAELCDLEQKYYANQIPEEPTIGSYTPEKAKLGCWHYGCSILPISLVIMALIGSGMDSSKSKVDEELGLLFNLAIIVVAIIIGGAVIVIPTMLNKRDYKKASLDYSKKEAIWKNEYNNWEKKRDEVTKIRRETIERAKSLLE